jgi:hypothetical protein
MQISCKFHANFMQIRPKMSSENPFRVPIDSDESEKFNGFPGKTNQLEWISAELPDKWRPAADANDR